MTATITKTKIVVALASYRILVLSSIEAARHTPGVLDYLLDNHLDELCAHGWLDNY